LSKKKLKAGRKRNQQKVLLDHKQVGKRYLPPLLQIGSFGEARWAEYTLPELLWLGILNQKYGRAKGAELGLLLARAAVKATVRESEQPVQWFGLTTAYATLEPAQQALLLKLLQPDQFQLLKDGLIIFPTFYPQCPLNFLYQGSAPVPERPDEMLEEFKKLLSTLFNRQNDPATFMQANGIYIAFLTDKLKVASGLALANFPEIENYPHTEESKRVASGVRAVTDISVMTMLKEKQSNWSAYFWNRGLEIQQCELEKIWTEYE